MVSRPTGRTRSVGVDSPHPFTGEVVDVEDALVNYTVEAGGKEEEEKMAEIPKAMVIERIRSQSGTEKANQADNELPDKIDTETDAELLRKYDIDPDELGESPAVG